MKHTDLSTPRTEKPSRTRFIGYILFGITVLACAVWIMYRYYLIKGWNLWEGWMIDHPAMNIIRNDIPITSIIVSLVAGLIGSSRKTKSLFFATCYLYTLLMTFVIPYIWHTEWNFSGIRGVLCEVIGLSSTFSVYIIPSFAISSFVAWCVKSLLRSRKKQISISSYEV